MNLSTNPFFTHGIDKLCTICHAILKNTDCTQSIFSTLDELKSPINVLQVLQSFSNFNFYNGPGMVCTTCYNKTIDVYKFIQMCNKAHENIQNYLKYEEGNERNVSNYEEMGKIEVDLKIEEITFDGRALVVEMENEKTSKIDEIVFSSTDIKIEERIFQQGMEEEETSNNEESFISTTEIVTQGKTDSSDVKIEELSIKPTKIIIDRREFVEELENEKISKPDELGMVISGTEIKIEERILKEASEKEETNYNEEITTSHTEIVTEELVVTDFDNFREKIDAQMYDERMVLIKCKDCHLVLSDKKELSAHRKEAKHTTEKPFLNKSRNALFGAKYNLRSLDAQRAHISKNLRLNQDRHQPLKDHVTDVVCTECQEVFKNDKELKT